MPQTPVYLGFLTRIGIGLWQECQEQWEDWTETEGSPKDIQVQGKTMF